MTKRAKENTAKKVTCAILGHDWRSCNVLSPGSGGLFVHVMICDRGHEKVHHSDYDSEEECPACIIRKALRRVHAT